jgi:hypothetical protein
VGGDRVAGAVGRCGSEAVEGLVGAAGYGHLGADDVHGCGAGAAGGVFGDLQEAGGAAGDGLVVEDVRVIGAGHAAVKVDLGVAGFDVFSDEDVGLGHGGVGGFALPAVGAEVVAAEDDAVAGEVLLVGDGEDHVAEVGGPHAGVAAVLVDLI